MTVNGLSFADLSPLANHLWQSTICVAAVWVLTFFLKNNRATVRYWLWFAASAKFLFPFSLLVDTGNRFETLIASSTPITQRSWSFAAENLSYPFAVTSTAVQPLSRTVLALVPVVLLSVWACGFMATLVSWLWSWRRLRAARRTAMPLPLGLPIPVMASSTQIEPGVIGIRKPVLLLPKGIIEHLTPAQLSAVLAHEMFHVRRRDNLTAAIHMLVEAVFWFYPPIWWIRAHLLEERERACDEAVLQSGSDAEIYAESILSACRFYLPSPMPCVSGLSGSDLKKRIVRIMKEQVSHKLGLGRKLVLSMAGVSVIALPLAFGVLNANRHFVMQLLHPTTASRSFEVVSIKPGRPDEQQGSGLRMTLDTLKTINVPAKRLIEFAYNIQNDDQLSGGPSWINSQIYDIEAKEEPTVSKEIQKLPFEQRADQIRFMVQSLLADRFHLKTHFATRELPIYALVPGKSGPKVTESTAIPPDAPGRDPSKPTKCCGIRMLGNGHIEGEGAPPDLIADVLSKQPEVDRMVVNETGLKGRYDFALNWAPEHPDPMFKKGSNTIAAGPNASSVDSSGPSLFAAVEEQLGLKLESRKGPVEVLVIDNIEKPSEN